MTVGSHATAAALKAYGGVRRIAVLTPYWPVMNAEVNGYFRDIGIEVVRDIALHCTSWTGIAEVTTAQCRDALRSSTATTSTRWCRSAPTCRWCAWRRRPSCGWASR